MSRSLSSDGSSAAPPAESAPSSDDLDAIRQLLFSQEKKQLDHLQERIENPVLHSQDVSQVLPQAVALASAKDGQLAVALTPAVEAALLASVKRNPSMLVSAIFPIIGPAVRKSVSELFSKLVQSLNQALEHSFSIRGLKWRWEAVRSGRPFAEVVMAHTLVYRVEQVFLIHKTTGLLLQHLTAAHVRSDDASMVSGMLTAIQDFAHDSFHAGAGEALHTLEIGELYVWVEASPLATLAAVIRGQAPYDYRTTLQDALEKTHRDLGATLQSFNGDAAPFELARTHLEPCLQAQFVEGARRKSSVRLALLCGLAVLTLAFWLTSILQEHRRWTRYLDRLKAQPGIIVTEAGKRSGKYVVAGLRDPLSADPERLLPPEIESGDVLMRWEPYEALNPEMALKRAIARLAPPSSVTLQVQDGVLVATGRAPHNWINRLRLRAPMLTGIHDLNDGGLADESRPALATLPEAIQSTKLTFADGVQLAPGQDAEIETLASLMNELLQAASRSGRRARVAVVGHTDKTGTEEYNLRLSRDRAEHIARALIAHGFPAGLLMATGVGSREPLSADMPEKEEFQNRRVTFRVELEDSRRPSAP